MYTSDLFKKWIIDHQNDDYQINVESEQTIKLTTSYGEATIQFTDVTNGTIVEFNIISYKNQEVQFYLHFELNDENHAHQLYDEMIETLIGLKDKKTTRVLLSCSSGLTTSMFADNLNSVVEMLGEDYHFDAVAYSNIYEQVENYDLVLIAPQIGYMLKRLQESLPDKLVLQIPTATFASYDAIGIYYRVYDQSTIIDQQTIIKASLDMNDLYDIIDTVLLKHHTIDVIGIATPGIIKDNQHLRSSIDGRDQDIKNEFEKKYHIDVFIYNNANAAVVGFSLEHEEYKNIIFHSQPFGFGVGGQGILVNGQVITGKEGIAGEVRFFLRRMQLSDDCQHLAWSQAGVKELVIKSLLPSISLIGPDAIALYSPMTPDTLEIEKGLLSFVPKEFIPTFYSIKEPWYYMLDGITKLCDEHLDEKGES